MIKKVLKPAFFCEVCEQEIEAPNMAIIANNKGQELHFCLEHYDKLKNYLSPQNSNYINDLFNADKKIIIAAGESRTVKI